jgi:chromate reductase, NAD(P)H dehydrogenase (quinone)
MKKIIVFGASNSRQSINKKLAIYAAGQLSNFEIEALDLNDYEMPIFSVDKESENGIHPLALKFKEKLKTADGFLISFAEHNGAYTAAYKNIYDWVSRIEKSFWGDKPLFLMATSPGARGGKSVLEMAYNRYSFTNKGEIVQFSLPSFNDNF